jgi:hypothetical protein
MFWLFWATAPGYGTPMVYYEGREAGGSSELQYAYRVDAGKDDPIMEFRVGTAQTGDLAIGNYTDVVKPNGWNFSVGEVTPPFDVYMTCYGGPTPIGGTATLLRQVSSSRCVLWWTDDTKSAISSFTFGFNHSGSARNAAWRLVDTRDTTLKEATLIVGLGDGPVHIPTALPEPGSLALLGLGGLAVISRARKLRVMGSPARKPE